MHCKKRNYQNKKAQFYIIAAVILVLVILGAAGISNYLSVKEEPIGFYNLGENLDFEGAKVIDYGIYGAEAIKYETEKFTETFAKYIESSGEDFNLILVYGNKDSASITTYTKGKTGEIKTDLGTVIPIIGELTSTTEAIPQGQENVEINMLNATYKFNLGENENFFFVISKSKGYENYVYEKI